MPPTSLDFAQGIRVFTGERLACASARHILDQEAARAVYLLGKQGAGILDTYEKATLWMRHEPGFYPTGLFCCGCCSLLFWRHGWVGEFMDKQASISKGVQKMRDYRQGDGKWRVFPFFYAVYTLAGLDLESARKELGYARPVMERYIKSSRTDMYGKRKAAILRHALEKTAQAFHPELKEFTGMTAP